MRKLISLFILSFYVTAAMADIGFFAGITYAIDAKDRFGISFKAISTRHENNPVYGAGITYYPDAVPEKQYGFDLSAGYQFDDSALLIGYDFMRKSPQISFGVTDTK